MLAKICHIDVLAEEGMILNTEVTMYNGKIVHIGSNPELEPERIWDGKGMTLVPGLIDLHVHGGAGYDFMDHTRTAVEAISQFHAMHGTTSLLATTMTAPLDQLEEILGFYKQLQGVSGAQILGLHLEGPFIHPNYKGAQNGIWIVLATLDHVKRLWDAAGNDLIRMVTLAPELIEDQSVFEWLERRGVTISVGHSDLDYQGGCRCIRYGVNHATHLGNAMRGFHHRDIGIIGLVMEQQEMTFDVIADGVHVSPAFIRLLTRVCSHEQIMLITDAMRAAGLQDGTYELGGQGVTVHKGEARLDSGVLAGSLLTLDVALANFMRFTGQSLAEAIPCLTMNPARKLGIEDRKGSIKVGKDADLVLLDPIGKVMATWVMGELVFEEREL